MQFFGVVSNPFVPIGDGSGPSNQFVQRVRVLGEFGGSGGPAYAKAQAVGSGPVEVDAEATGGAGSLWSTSYAHLRHEGGPARAEASGTGSEGRVGALAASNAPTLSLEIGAATTLLQTARVEARIAPDALDPPKLGRLRVQLDISESQAVARIVASSPEAAALLTRERDDLTRAFLAQGFDDVQVRIDTDQDSTPRGRAERDGGNGGVNDGSAPTETQDPEDSARPRSPGSRAIDLFV